MLARLAVAALGAMLLAPAAAADAPAASGGRACAGVGAWLDPATGETLAPATLIAALARRPVVLLGEEHDNAEHHGWQLQMLAALHALRPDLIAGFEMFPRRVQPALDRWAAGAIDVAAFLEESDWNEVWRFDAELYLPLFRFVRRNRLAMVALNVDSALVARVGREGWAAVPADRRAGLTDPAAASDAYRRYLADVFVEKLRLGVAGRPRRTEGEAPAAPPDRASVMATEEFERFVAAQLTWDRAMAEAIAGARRQRPGSLVVGVVGRGHVQFGHGVPHQLRDLGVHDAAVLLPVEAAAACKGLEAGIADAVFVVEPRERIAPPAPRPRLGVVIQKTDDGVRVTRVMEGSVAQASALAADDVVVSAAGRPVETVAQLVEIVGRQAPGTWLPLTIRRRGREIEVVAKFPTRFEAPR